VLQTPQNIDARLFSNQRSIDRIIDIAYLGNVPLPFSQAALLGYYIRQERSGRDHHRAGKAYATTPIAISPTSKPTIRILYELINATFERQQSAAAFSHRPGPTKEGACGQADREFAVAIAHIAGAYQSDNGARIISDGSRPLLLQKTHSYPTALALQDIRVGDMNYPAGSIMGVTMEMPDRLNFGPEYCSPKAGTIETAPASAITGLSFIRPSLFAIDPSEREKYVVRHHDINSLYFDPPHQEATMDSLRTHSIADIGQLAADHITGLGWHA
jgi:hypothetical protein